MKNCFVLTVFILLGIASACQGQTVYAMGNSLMNDTNDELWSDASAIYCSKNLCYEFANPSGFCIISTSWDSWDVLPEDTVVLQPFDGENATEAALCFDGIVNGRTQNVVLHTCTWVWGQFPDWYQNGHPSGDVHQWSPSRNWNSIMVFNLNSLGYQHVKRTRVNDLMFLLWEEGANLQEDYGRDFIHFSLGLGRDMCQSMLQITLGGHPVEGLPSYELDAIHRIWEGDVNRDGYVNLLDVEGFITALGTSDFCADVNFDGFVNLLDIPPFIDMFIE